MQNSKDDPFDLDEVVQLLQRKQLDKLWSHLHVKCSSVLLDFGRIGSQESDHVRHTFCIIEDLCPACSSNRQSEYFDVWIFLIFFFH